MSTTAVARTWDAEIRYEAPTVVPYTVPAEAPRWDLVRECEAAALREAVEYVREGLADAASVAIFKTTKARGREQDRPGGYVYRDTHGDVVAVRWGR